MLNQNEDELGTDILSALGISDEDLDDHEDMFKTLSVLNLERARMADVRMVPETPKDLHDYIHAYLGYNVPQTGVCEGHVAPFDFMADQFFDKQLYAIVFANRTGGKTLNVSMLHHMNMWHKPNYDVVTVGAIREQAAKSIQYLHNFSDIKWFHSDLTYQVATRLSYRWHSDITILSGTTSGVNSPHPVCACLDEIDLMPMPLINEALSMPISKNGYLASMMLTSTRKYASGTMAQLLLRARNDPNYPFRVYSWCIFEVLNCQCTPNQRKLCQQARRMNVAGHSESFYDICKGKAAKGDGFYSLDDVLNKFVLMEASVFDAQWLCLRPGVSSLIFPEFDSGFHHRSFMIPALSDDESTRAQWNVYVVMDFGWTDPLCILFVGENKQTGDVFIFDELYSSQLEKKEVKEWLLKKFHLYHLPFDQIIYSDKRSPRDIHEFVTDYGIQCRPVGLDIMPGLQAIRPYLTGHISGGHPSLFIHEQNVRALPMELETYSWMIDNQTGKPTGEKPASHQADHAIDCLRYAMLVMGKVPGLIRAIMSKTNPQIRPELATPTGKWTKRIGQGRRSQVPTNSRWRRR